MKFYHIRLKEPLTLDSSVILGFKTKISHKISDHILCACRQIETKIQNESPIFEIKFNDNQLDVETIELLVELGVLHLEKLKVDDRTAYTFNVMFFYRCLSDVIKFEEDMSILEFIMDNAKCDRTLL